MRSLTKSLVVAGILGTVGLTSLAGVGIVSAESGTTSSTTSSDPMSSLVQAIASKFNLNKADVQKVFDDNRTAREAEHAQKESANLQKLVDAGTITAGQKTAIEAKLKAMQTERDTDREAMKSLTDAQRKAKMDEKRTELESWAKEQGIDLSKLKGIFGGPGGHGGMPPQ